MALSDTDKAAFEAIIGGRYDVCLAQSELDGKQVSVICLVQYDDGEEVIMTPMALMLTEELADRLIDPSVLMERDGG